MKMFVLCLCMSLIGIISAESYGYRPRRSYPHQTMMFGGFYGHPSYMPQGAMSGFANRDTVMTNSFAGNEHPFMGIPNDESTNDEASVQTPNLTETTNDEATVEEEEEEDEIVQPTTTTVKPKKRIPKRKLKPTQPPKVENDDEEEQGWPLKSHGGPSYNSFFPIMFGGGRGGNTRSGESDGNYPGSATAIANSFSTGKGGVASSHAVAYGDPYLSMLLRNGGGVKRKNNQD